MLQKLQIAFILLLLNAFVFPSLAIAQAQTDGTFIFTFTETHSGSSENVLAVWVTDNSGTFVKTRMRFWGSETNDHLPSWKSNSGQNVVDAITGPTLTSYTNPTAFGEKTVVWDGKDVTGTTVPDGTYKVFVETSWNNPSPPDNQHSDLISFTFEKSQDTTHATPTGDNYFSDITLDWYPDATTGITKIKQQVISVYPNPSNGLIQINFDKPVNVSTIRVRKMSGQEVYHEIANKIPDQHISLDLTGLSPGTYFVEMFSYNNRNIGSAKCIITK